MQTNKHLHLWFPTMGLHALHQVEESISFWQWYIDFVDKIPSWLQLPRVLESAHLTIAHPEYFIGASIGQLALVALIAFLCRKSEKATRIALGIYLIGLSFFFGMAHFDKLFYSFLFSCNGNLYYRCVFHPQMELSVI